MGRPRGPWAATPLTRIFETAVGGVRGHATPYPANGGWLAERQTGPCPTDECRPAHGVETQPRTIGILRVTDSGSHGDCRDLNAVVSSAAVTTLPPHPFRTNRKGHTPLLSCYFLVRTTGQPPRRSWSTCRPGRVRPRADSRTSTCSAGCRPVPPGSCRPWCCPRTPRPDRPVPENRE